MNVASKDLSEELFKVSGWGTGYWLHNWPKNDDTVEYVVLKDGEDWIDDGVKVGGNICPAYDSGYLLRKLPHFIILQQSSGGYTPNGWFASKDNSQDYPGYASCKADTPEDALCKLAIELFKQGVLTQEGVNRE